MKTDKEFKSEVYARASRERARIKKRNRMIMTVVPCFVIAVTAAVSAVYFSTSFFMKDSMPEDMPMDAGNYAQTEEIPEEVRIASLPTEVQGYYQSPDSGDDFGEESVKSGSNALPTENHAAAAPTEKNSQKGDSNRLTLNYDFKAFPDKTEKRKNGLPDATVIESRKQLSEYLAAQEKSETMSEELKAELLSKDDEFFSRNTVVIITADREYALADCRAESEDGTLTVSLKETESESSVGCHMILTVYDKHFTNVVLRDA